MKEVSKISECMMWEAPVPESASGHRMMGLMFADFTSTIDVAVGCVILPPGKQQPKSSTHPGEEIYLVLRGTGQFMLGDQVFDIEPGTAVYVGPEVGHRAINTGEEEMQLYYVNTHPRFRYAEGTEGYLEAMKDWKRIR